MKTNENTLKVIGAATLAGLATIIVELFMYHQVGVSLTSGTVWGRVAFMVVLVGFIIGLALADWRFDGYVTIVGMLLCALANFGGFSQVTDRLSPGGLAIQLIAIVGFLASLAGVWYGIIQRKNYTARKLKERLK